MVPGLGPLFFLALELLFLLNWIESSLKRLSTFLLCSGWISLVVELLLHRYPWSILGKRLSFLLVERQSCLLEGSCFLLFCTCSKDWWMLLYFLVIRGIPKCYCLRKIKPCLWRLLVYDALWFTIWISRSRIFTSWKKNLPTSVIERKRKPIASS